MICKYCGSKLTGSICPSCNKVASLSYTSHELADMTGTGRKPKPNDDGLQSVYNNGLATGREQGFIDGYDTAKQEFAKTAKRKQRFFIVVAVCAAVALALLGSVVTGIIRYNSGYHKGMLTGKQEQYNSDKSEIEDTYQQGYKAGKDEGYDAAYQAGKDEGYNAGYQAGKDEGYNAGYQAGKDEGYNAGYKQGLSVTPATTRTSSPTPAVTPAVTPTITPTDTPESTPAPTAKPLMIKRSSKGNEVRQLQERLIALGYLAENEADGIFGSKTEKAVRQFQTDNDCESTGTVDQKLWDFVMSEAVVSATPSDQPATETPEVQPTEATAPEADTDHDPEESVEIDLPDSELTAEPDMVDDTTDQLAV